MLSRQGQPWGVSMRVGTLVRLRLAVLLGDVAASEVEADAGSRVLRQRVSRGERKQNPSLGAASGWEVGEARRPFAALLEQLFGARSAPVRVETHERVSEAAMHGKHEHAESVGSITGAAQ